jgi:thiol-disulfide isomerase/thioredoxin
VDERTDATLSIPSADLAILNAQDWYGTPSDEAWEIANRYFDIAVVGFFPQPILSVARKFKGQVVLVNLWATWCPPCVAELPSLEILHARLRGQGFAVVALSLDRGSVEKVAAFWDKRGIEQLDFFWDRDGLVPRRWSYEAIPTSYLLDRTGRVVKTYAGAYKWDEPEIFGEIERQVKEGTE